MTSISYNLKKTWQLRPYEPMTAELGMVDELREGEKPQDAFARLRGQIEPTMEKIQKEIVDDSD